MAYVVILKYEFYSEKNQPSNGYILGFFFLELFHVLKTREII